MGRRGPVQQTSQGRKALRWQRARQSFTSDDPLWTGGWHPSIPIHSQPRDHHACVKCGSTIDGAALFCDGCLYRP